MSEEIWGIVSLMGHSKVAGRLSEYTLGGNFLRVDIPPVNGTQGITRLFGVNAIFEITITDREVAEKAAEAIDFTPFDAFTMKAMVAKVVQYRLQGEQEDDSDYADRPF